jgi:hypothetical protein
MAGPHTWDSDTAARQEVLGLGKDLDRFRSELLGDIARLRSELQADIGRLRRTQSAIDIRLKVAHEAELAHADFQRDLWSGLFWFTTAVISGLAVLLTIRGR